MVIGPEYPQAVTVRLNEMDPVSGRVGRHPES